ncbi:cobalamin biosynthesis protein [Candidatus Methanomassiliicoccus intestinalis]|uniref:Probable cobalamin biosynthesis protein CobD n=1 Tax=Candidatus Methanomassiliicoccus intestinalis TaxID=1406512 RepID=A0A8J8PCP4_9ARCH|nr:MAG: hypothetical protein A3207_08105 [Candidatus Methanomassiliicoccus intestinalis]
MTFLEGVELLLLEVVLLIPIGALLIDLIFGELPNKLHPVVWMGKVIGFLDDHVQRKSQRHDRICGVFVSLIPVLLFTLAFILILGAIRIYGGDYGLIVWEVLSALLFSTLFAIKSLGTHTLPIMNDLKNNDIEAARKKASMVVSRNVNELDEAHIISCASETVAENLVDSVISPMFYFGIAGIPGATILRVVNTEDGMIGYLNEKHKNVGMFAAKLDDALHYITARLSVPFIMLASALLGYDWRNAWKIAKRDHKQTSSPNKGWPMSAVAGALRIKMEKEGYYSLGDGELQNDPEIIAKTVKLMKVTSILFFIIVLIPLYLIIGTTVQILLENAFFGLL